MTHRPHCPVLRGKPWWPLLLLLGAATLLPARAQGADAACTAVQAACETLEKGKKPPRWVVVGRNAAAADGSSADAPGTLDLQGLDGERIAAVSLHCGKTKPGLPGLDTLVSAHLALIGTRHHACKLEPMGERINAQVTVVDKDQAWLLLRPLLDAHQSAQQEADQRPARLTLKVGDAALKPAVKTLAPGDHVRVVYSVDGPDRSLEQFDWQSHQVGRWPALFWLAGALALVAGCALLFTRRNPMQLFVGEDGRYSTSKFQAAMWFWLVFAGYLSFVVLRCWYTDFGFIGGIAIPENLVLLSGISVLTVAGAKAITSSKVEAARALPPSAAAVAVPGVSPPAVTPKYPATETRLVDLVRDDFKRVDLGDFQSVLVTLIAVGVYGLTLVQHLSLIEFRQEVALPPLDATLLALFGLSQGGYLGKKAAGDVGAGMTPQQAAARATELAAAVQQAAERAEQANADGGRQRQRAAAELASARAASSQTPAKAAHAEASTAAAATKAAADRCAEAHAQGKAALDELAKLRTDWRTEPAAQAATQHALDDATRHQARSDVAVTAANGLVSSADADAKAAMSEALKKPPP